MNEMHPIFSNIPNYNFKIKDIYPKLLSNNCVVVRERNILTGETTIYEDYRDIMNIANKDKECDIRAGIMDQRPVIILETLKYSGYIGAFIGMESNDNGEICHFYIFTNVGDVIVSSMPRFSSEKSIEEKLYGRHYFYSNYIDIYNDNSIDKYAGSFAIFGSKEDVYSYRDSLIEHAELSIEKLKNDSAYHLSRMDTFFIYDKDEGIENPPFAAISLEGMESMNDIKNKLLYTNLLNEAQEIIDDWPNESHNLNSIMNIVKLIKETVSQCTSNACIKEINELTEIKTKLLDIAKEMIEKEGENYDISWY